MGDRVYLVVVYGLMMIAGFELFVIFPFVNSSLQWLLAIMFGVGIIGFINGFSVRTRRRLE